MIDEQAEAQKARIEALHERWTGPLGLQWWHWTLRWHRGAIPDAPNAVFLITVRFEYHDVILSTDLTRIEDMSDEELERRYCHELGHVFTIPIKDAAAQGIEGNAMHFLEEHQASAIGSALLWLRNSLTKAED